MWIVERAGKYRYCERYKDPLTGKNKTVSITLASNSRQAHKQAMITLQEKIEKILKSDPSKANLMDVYKEFYEQKAFSVKEGTIFAAQNAINLLFRQFPTTDITLQKLNTRLIQQAVNTLIKSHTYTYVKRGLGELKQMLKYAERLGLIHDIRFIDKVEVPKKPKTKEQVERDRFKFLEYNELKEFLTKLEDINPHVAMLFEFQSLTGLRFGELIALRFEDYDRATHTIDVNGTLNWRKPASDPASRGTPKNKHSYRKVELVGNRARWIIDYFITMSKARKMWKPKIPNNTYIFTTDGGLPYNLQYCNKLLKQVPFHKPVSSHTFRHTHISMLAAANVPLKAIMERVGHNEPRTTLAIYTHVTEAMKAETRSALEAIEQRLNQQDVI